MAILNNSNAISSGGYDINNSLRLRASASAYLNRTPASNGNQQIFTLSGWVKRGQLSSEQAIIVCRTGSNAAFGRLVFTSGDALQFFARNSSSTTTALLNTTQVFRDPSAWYHIVLAVDTTQATAANRIKFYVNGTQITAFSTATYPSQNTNLDFNTTADTYIGVEIPNAIYFDGYMAEVNFVNAQQLTPSSFGETDTTTGSWKPKAYTGTYGTNGFYLKFSDIATTSGSNAGLGKDFSGNTNYWTTNNISVTAGTTYDAMTDSPTLTSATVANYCVMNPLTAQGVTTSEANLSISGNTGSNQRILGTIATGTSGKFYWEVTTTNAFQAVVGVAIQSSNVYMEAVGDGNYYYGGNTKINGSAGPTLSTYTNGDVIGVAFDSSTGKIYFSKNGTWQNSGDPAAGTGSVGTLTGGNDWFAGSASQGTSTYNHKYNFGQRPFAYTPPTGFVRLNTYNLPDSTIKKGNTVMDATLYTGTSATTLTVTNSAGFQPDLTWIKARSAANNNVLQDSVRGTGATKKLYSNLTEAENGANAQYGSVSAFNSNGFSLADGTLGGDQTKGNSITYVGWQWQAGQGSSSSNTSGSITSTVSVNATAGFSVVTYTGTGANATVGHGLGVAPKMIIAKGRGNVDNWPVYHASANASPATGHLLLNSTAAFTSTSSTWNNTAPSSTVFTVGTDTRINQNTITYVAYCWAEIAGFSKFGSYTGNGSTDGPFVYLGFRPKFLMWKRTDITSNWNIEDSYREAYNSATSPNELYANLSNAEGTNGSPIFLSNGFKLTSTGAGYNASGGTYIYMAFAECPTKHALAR
jgi:hypothetical protein